MEPQQPTRPLQPCPYCLRPYRARHDAPGGICCPICPDQDPNLPLTSLRHAVLRHLAQTPAPGRYAPRPTHEAWQRMRNFIGQITTDEWRQFDTITGCDRLIANRTYRAPTHPAGSWFIAPEDNPTDEWAVGYDHNQFATAALAEQEIPALTETIGGKWVVRQRSPESDRTVAGDPRA